MHRPLFLCAVSAVLAGWVGPIAAAPAPPADASSAAAAPPVEPTDAEKRQAAHDLEGRRAADPADAPPLRRGGFLFGLGVAAALGGASGYPNDVAKIDRPEYYTNTGAGFGAGGSLWLGYTIADWVSFGLAVNVAAADTGDAVVRAGGAGVRVELFPLWPLGGQWQELGVLLEPGLGFTMVESTEDALDPLIESGGGSHLSLGLFYEGLRLWQLSMGPYLAADMIWSSSSFNPMGMLGWRTAYYAGP